MKGEVRKRKRFVERKGNVCVCVCVRIREGEREEGGKMSPWQEKAKM